MQCAGLQKHSINYISDWHLRQRAHSHVDGTGLRTHVCSDAEYLSNDHSLNSFLLPYCHHSDSFVWVTMIDKSQGFFNDAPPPYQHVLQSSSDSKVNLSHDAPDPPQTSRSSLSKRTPKASRWFPTSIFGLSKTAKQVRSATQEFLRDLLSQARPSEHEWLSLFSNCTRTCNAQGLDFSALLQEPFVEGHLPVYWAILKRQPAAAAAVTKTDHHTSPASDRDPDALVLAILDASLPINAASVADARLACVTVSDNALFVRLGLRYEAFSPRSGTDRVLLGGSDAVDTVSVKEARGGGSNVSAAFTVRFSITQFQLRMRVSKQVRIEFIARGTFLFLIGHGLYTEISHLSFFTFGLVCLCMDREIMVPLVFRRSPKYWTAPWYKPCWGVAHLARSCRA